MEIKGGGARGSNRRSLCPAPLHTCRYTLRIRNRASNIFLLSTFLPRSFKIFRHPRAKRCGDFIRRIQERLQCFAFLTRTFLRKLERKKKKKIPSLCSRDSAWNSVWNAGRYCNIAESLQNEETDYSYNIERQRVKNIADGGRLRIHRVITGYN